MKNTLITFHVGRGGRFHNAGHKTYSGTNETIDDVRGQIGDKHPSYLRYENIADVLKPFDNTPNFEKIRELIDNCENDNCYNSELLKYKITEENLGELIWVDSNGSQMMWENEDGTGSIDIDKEYNSYFVKTLEDCDQLELELYSEYNEDKIFEYFESIFEIKQLEDECYVVNGCETEYTEKSKVIEYIINEFY